MARFIKKRISWKSMGLSIYGVGTEEYFSCTYGLWHDLRSLACQADGYDESLEFLVGDDHFRSNTRFRQFVCFSDHEGILVPQRRLSGIDYENSFSLGSSDKLLQELEALKKYLRKNRNFADVLERSLFSELYGLVKKEVNGGMGILVYR